MQLLSVADTWIAAHLVQERAVPFARRQRPSWCSAGFWPGPTREHRYPCLGLHRGGALSRHTAAAFGLGTSRRSGTRESGDARLRDWNGCGTNPGQPAGTYQSRADLGGRPDPRAVVPEPEDELFHAPWEPRVLALTVAMGATGFWNIDRSRAARETLANYADL